MFIETKAINALEQMWAKVGIKDQERIKGLMLPKDIHIENKDFGPDKDGYQSLSYMWPEKSGRKLPVIVDIHGGGFMYGTKELNKPFAMYLSSLGFLVMTMSYRLAPKAKLKDQLKDIYESLVTLYEDKDHIPADLDNLFLTGDSAGGMLASVFAAAQVNPKILSLLGKGPLPLKFKAVVLNHPASYLNKPRKFTNGLSQRQKAISRAMIYQLYGPWYKRDWKLMNVTGNFDSLLRHAKGYIPTMLITSMGDKQFRDGAYAIAKALNSYGMEHELYDGREEPDDHVFNVTWINSPAAIKANVKIAEFFRKHM